MENLFSLIKDTGSVSQLLSFVEEGVILVDQERKISWCNQASLNFFSKAGNCVDFIGRALEDGLSWKPYDYKLAALSTDSAGPEVSVRIINTFRTGEEICKILIVTLNPDNENPSFALFLKRIGSPSEILGGAGEQHYKELFRQALEGIFILDGNGWIKDVNPAACRIYGIEKDEFLKKNIRDLFPQNTSEQNEKIYSHFIKTGSIKGFYKFRRVCGAYRYIDFNAKTNFINGFHLAVFVDVTEKHQAQRALRNSEEELKAIFNSSSHQIVLLDENFNVVQFNKNANDAAKVVNRLGLLKGMNFCQQFAGFTSESPDDPDYIFNRALNGEQINMEMNPFPDHKDYWLELLISPVFNADGKVKNICVNCSDISSRKKAELFLAESEARYRSLIQNSSDLVAVLEINSQVNYVSSSVERIIGYNEAGLRGKYFLDYIHPADKEKFESALKEVLDRKSGGSSAEFRFLHSEGFYVFLEGIFNNQLENPFINGIVINGRDITERKFQEESLLLLERAIDSSNNGIIITDPNQPDNPIVYANKAFERITGYNYLEVIGKNSRFLQRKDTRQAEIRKIRKAVKENKTVSVTIRNYKKDGTLFWNYLNISPVFNREGNLSNFIGVINDITERKLSEAAIQQINHSLAGVSEKEFFESLVTHIGYSLNIDAVFIGELSENKIATRGFLQDQKVRGNFCFKLNDGPVNRIVANARNFVSNELHKQYPDSFWVSEGYSGFIGIPLIASHGSVIGIIAMLSRKPFENIHLFEQLLNLFSFRTSAELEREQHLKILELSESKFRSLAENSPDLILIVDTNADKISYCNRRNIFGFRTREFVSYNDFLKLLHPDDRRKGEEIFADLKENKGNNIAPEDFRLIKKSGEEEWLTARYTVIEKKDQRNLRILINLSSIHERKKAEEALKENESKLKALIENTDDLLWSTDMDLNFTTMNAAFISFVQQHYQIAVKIGNSLRQILPDEIRKNWVNLHENALRGERGISEFCICKQEEKFYEISFNPILSEDGVVRGVSVFGRDITRRKIAENNIIRTNFELDSFVYRASHDLRAPLRSVLGLINLVKVESDKNQAIEYLNLVDKSIAKLDTFISDLINYSRNSRLELEGKKIDFAEIVKECEENLKFMEKAERVSILKEVNEDFPFWSDPMRISIIIQNLVSNSIKYQNVYRDDAFCKISVVTSAAGAEIIISDNGRGIRKEYIDKIFQMFFRASQDSYGSGLGLYITRQIVEKLKGRIYVSSEYGTGTEFRIVLPTLHSN